MVFHILNGDAIAEQLPGNMEGRQIIIREAFIEGPLSLNYTGEYWEKRHAFVAQMYDADKSDYDEQFISQLKLLDSIKNGDEVNLWFEDDLFCLVNMWFTISYLSKRTAADLFRVFPEHDNKTWIGFAKTANLQQHLEERVPFTADEIALSNQLWEAYVINDRQRLKALAASDTECFRFLPQVIQAHLDRTPDDGSTGRPQQTLIDILNDGKTDFYEIFEAFWKKDSIYGFGDLQVYNMLREMEIEFTDEI